MNKKSDEKSVFAFLYPDKIIIETRNKKDDFISYTTANFTILPVDISDTVLGETILRHLEQSEEKDASTAEIKSLWESFKKNTKLKTDKAIATNARCTGIFMENNKLRFEPKKTMVSQKAFWGMPDAIWELSHSVNTEHIGSEAKKAWLKCDYAA